MRGILVDGIHWLSKVMKLVFICESTMHCYITILRDHIVMQEEYEKDGK
jgi:hypothetical protein